MTSNDFVLKHIFKNKETSNIKTYQVLCSIRSNNVRIYLRDGPIESDIRIVYLHPTKRTHWVVYINENYFDSYGCVCPKKLSKFFVKRNGYCLCSQNKIQSLRNKKDSFCASYCFYIIYSTKVLEIDSKSDVLNIYYQII